MSFRTGNERHIDAYEMVFDAAYQGAPGAYSEEAAQRLLGVTARLLPRATLEQVFEAVEAQGAHHAVIPIENSLSGTVPNAYELLLTHDLRVIGETRIPIDHVLVAPRGTDRNQVRRVLSHPVALAQCSEFFRSHRSIQAVPVFDTAGAVEIVLREDDGQTAAIAARRTAELYGAVILAEHLQDHPENWTRFLLLASAKVTSPPAENAGRALVAFGLPHEPGALLRVLMPLETHKVNLTKIESRPIHGKPFEYQFVVEMTAPPGTHNLTLVLDDIRACTSWLRVFGLYS